MGRMKEWDAEAEQDADLSTVQGRLTWARLRTGMTQQDVAGAIDKSRVTVTQYESGIISPSLSVLEALAETLGVDPRFLAFGGEVRAADAGFAGGRLVPVVATDDTASPYHSIGLPPAVLADLRARGKPLSFVRLELDAPHFALHAGDYLLLETGLDRIEPDGRLYAVRSTMGLAVVRSEPQLGMGASDALLITGGRAQAYREEAVLQPVGRLLGIVQPR